jgi:hypothetical protein
MGRSLGTYSTAKGWFRLIFPPAEQQASIFPLTLRVTSLGYKPLDITLTGPPSKASPLALRLAPLSFRLSDVEVRALSADEIVSRAIAARRTNAGNLTSVTSTLYSKVKGSGTFKLPFRDPQRQEAIWETIAKVEDTYTPRRTQKTTILQRRQTANINAGRNLAVLDEFFNFSDDAVKILNVRLTTPLATNALGVYAYEFLGQKPDGNGGLAYAIGFKPRSSAFPGFSGTLVISDRTFALMEADFRPTESAIPFIKSIAYKQKFTEYTVQGREVWIPTYLTITMNLATQAAMGTIKVEGELTAQSIVQNVNINAAGGVVSSPPPTTAPNLASTTIAANKPSKPKVPKKLTKTIVAPNVDSAQTEFWQQNSLYALSDDELATYRRVDSTKRAKELEQQAEKKNPSAQAGASQTGASQTGTSQARRGTSVRFSLSLGGGGSDEDDDSGSSVSMRASVRQDGAANAPEAPSQLSPVNLNALLPITLSSVATIGLNPIVNFSRTTNFLLGAEILPQFTDTTGRNIVTLCLRGMTDTRTADQRRLWGEASAQVELLRWNAQNAQNESSQSRSTGDTEDTTWSEADFEAQFLRDSVAMNTPAPLVRSGSVGVFGSAFSRLSSMQSRRLTASILTPFNLNADYLLFGNHFDFYREDGWTAGVGLAMDVLGSSLRASLARTEARNFALNTTNEQERSGGRSNLAALDGSVRTWRVMADVNYPEPLLPLAPLSTERVQAGFSIMGEMGEYAGSSSSAASTEPFSKAEANAFLLVPTFATGYAPMAALLTASAGIASASTPVQRQFLALRRFVVMGGIHDVMTIPAGGVGGTQYAQARLEHSFGDLWWRALRLPTLNGRGLGINLFANAAYYANNSPMSASLLASTDGQIYGEVGFGIDRIPTFLWDFLYLRFDAAWGVTGTETIHRTAQPPFGFTVAVYIGL